MAAPKLVHNLALLKKNSLAWAHQVDLRTHGRLGVLTGAASQAFMPDSVITAAAIAFFAVISLFPLTLLTIAIASFSLGSAMDQTLIIQRLEFIAPALGQLLGQNIDEIIKARGPMTGFALIGLVWSTSTIFSTLNQTLNVIWGNKRRRPIWKQRGIGILVILAFVGPVLMLMSFATSMFANLRTWMPNQIMPVGDGISFLAAILLDFVLFMVVYMILPHGASTWHEVLPGAVWAGLLWEMAKRVFLFFISTYISVSNLIYGSVAAIIAFLTWAYLSGIIFLFGAFVSVAYYRLKRQQEPESQITKT